MPSLEAIYLINITITAMAFGFWKDSVAAGVFMASTIFGVSMLIMNVFMR